MVGAAPLSRLVVVVALLCDSALASCFCGGEGLTAAAFAVLASAGEGAGFFAAAVVCADLAGAAADFGFAGSAGVGAPWSSLFDPNRLLKNPPELPAEATCTDERGAGAGFDSAEARLMVPKIESEEGVSAGGLTCGGIVPIAVRIVAPGPPWDFTAARKVGFMPPSTPILTGAAGVPRLINSAVWVSSRRCLSLTAATRSSGTL